jgi:hypothetical protein
MHGGLLHGLHRDYEDDNSNDDNISLRDLIEQAEVLDPKTWPSMSSTDQKPCRPQASDSTVVAAQPALRLR